MIPYPYVNIHLASTDGMPPAIETVRYDQFVRNLVKPQTAELMKLHAGLGVCGEAGELADAIKREVIYGKPTDKTNIVEELGDLQWYIQLTMILYDISPQDVFQANADKLSKRYVSLKYSDKEAINRADKSST